jgi:cell division protein FtsQ
MRELAGNLLEQSKSWAKSGVLLLLTVIIVWQLTAWLGKPTTMPIKHVRIGGELNYVAHEDISTSLSSLVQTGYFSMNTADIINKLTDIEWIKKAHIRRVWPDTILLIVEEQRPVAVWNETALLNVNGEIFKPEFDNSSLQLPRLSGVDDHSKVVLAEQKKIDQSINILDLSVEKLTLAEHGSWSAVLSNGVKIKAGYELPEKKISKSLLLLASIEGGLIEHLDEVDVRYPNGVAVTWKAGYKFDEAMVKKATLAMNKSQPTKS